MYTRFSRRFCKKFVSLITASRSEHLSITSGYWQTSGISDRLTNSFPPAALYSLNLSSREISTTIMSGQKEKYTINYEQLLEAQKDSSFLIVDVREDSEINKTGKLPGSIHVPKDNVADILQSLPEEDFMKRYGLPKPNKSSKIIFSCQSGRRSGMVQDQMQKLGYENVYNYIGGWSEWESKHKCN